MTRVNFWKKHMPKFQCLLSTRLTSYTDVQKALCSWNNFLHGGSVQYNIPVRKFLLTKWQNSISIFFIDARSKMRKAVNATVVCSLIKSVNYFFKLSCVNFHMVTKKPDPLGVTEISKPGMGEEATI